ncbi:MAG: hypothetical protein F2954_05245 [Actinobacteria bacterium]|uniref:Unannotated protein n=1 Tax=freshwater metagenome TaxID=449393 RepID=A0A6J7VZL1_9ZZZZ|nr:hypothetical protein [Actinomycetota bacterium]
MKFKQLRYSKGWIAVLATIVGLGFGSYTFINRAVTSQVYVTNCGILDYKPTAILKYCGETDEGIDKIQWLTWGADGASAEGQYQINDCKPTCDVGKIHFAEVQIVLSKSKVIDGKRALTFITIESADGSALPLNNSSSDAWPLELAG